MFRRLGGGSVISAVTLLLITAGSVAAHNANAVMVCGEERTEVQVTGGGYPEGSTYTVSIDGGAVQGPFDANISGTAVYDAGSPEAAHTAVVSFTSSDGKTQFNFVFNLSAEACVTVATPAPTPTATPTATQTPEGSVQGGTGTPEPSQPDTAMGEMGGNGAIPAVAFGLILLAALSGLAWANVRTARNR